MPRRLPIDETFSTAMRTTLDELNLTIGRLETVRDIAARTVGWNTAQPAVQSDYERNFKALMKSLRFLDEPLAVILGREDTMNRKGEK